MKVTRLGWAAVLVFLLFFAHPRHLWLNNLGLLAVLAGLLLRVRGAGDSPASPRALEAGTLLLALGFALMCTSLRHWFSSLFVWSAFAVLARRRPWAGFDGLWPSGDFSLERAFRLGEKRTLALVLLAAIYLRFKLVYAW